MGQCCAYTPQTDGTLQNIFTSSLRCFFFDEKKRLTTTTCLPAFIRRGLFICLCISIKLLEFIFTTYLRFNTTMHGHANPRRRELLHLIHKQFFSICVIQVVQMSENIISQLMGFYLSAALLLPCLSWFSLISFFKMTSKQHFVHRTNNQTCSCLYCFLHSVKCAS